MSHGILQLGLTMRLFHGVITTRGSDLCSEVLRVQAKEEKQERRGEARAREEERGSGSPWGWGAGVPAEGSIAPAQPGGQPARLLAPRFSSPKQCLRWARSVVLRQQL